MKFLLIILVVIGLILLGVLTFLKYVRKTLGNIFPPNNPNQKKQDDVIYRNDDVVVLKGEAKNKPKEKK